MTIHYLHVIYQQCLEYGSISKNRKTNEYSLFACNLSNDGKSKLNTGKILENRHTNFLINPFRYFLFSPKQHSFYPSQRIKWYFTGAVNSFKKIKIILLNNGKIIKFSFDGKIRDLMLIKGMVELAHLM